MNSFEQDLDHLISVVLPSLQSDLSDFWARHKWYDGESLGEERASKLDWACEGLVLKALSSLRRGYTGYSEESGRIGVSGQNSDEWAFVVDALDGTHNAAFGFPGFTTSIALFVQGHLTLGWVYDPNRNEVFVARKDHGAYLGSVHGSHRLRVRDVAVLSDAVVSSFRPRLEEEIPFYAQLSHRCKKFRSLSCSSLEICYVASGVYNAFVDFRCVGSERDCDIAAAMLILHEAGGFILDACGNPYRINLPSADSITIRRNVLATATVSLAQEILEMASSLNGTVLEGGTS